MRPRRVEDSSTPTERRLTFRSTCRPSCECRRWKPVTLERIVDTIIRSRLYIWSRGDIDYIPDRKRRSAIAFIPDCGFYFSIRYDERNLVGISEHFYFTDMICTVSMMIHETHLTKSRTTLSWWLSRVSLLWLLSPFFLVSFLFLSTEQPYLTFPCLCSSPTCFDRLGSLIQHFFLASLKRPLNSKRNCGYALRNNNVAKGNKNEDKRMHGCLYL